MPQVEQENDGHDMQKRDDRGVRSKVSQCLCQHIGRNKQESLDNNAGRKIHLIIDFRTGPDL